MECSKCRLVKNSDCFRKKRKQCKDCEREVGRKYYHAKKDKIDIGQITKHCLKLKQFIKQEKIKDDIDEYMKKYNEHLNTLICETPCCGKLLRALSTSYQMETFDNTQGNDLEHSKNDKDWTIRRLIS